MMKKTLNWTLYTLLFILLLSSTTLAISGRTVKGYVRYANDSNMGLEGAVVTLNTVPFSKACYQEGKLEFCCKCSTDAIVEKHRLTWEGGGYNILTNNLMFQKDCPGLNALAGDDCDGAISDDSRLWIEVDTPLEHLSSPIGDEYTFGSYYVEDPVFADVINLELAVPKPQYDRYFKEIERRERGPVTVLWIVIILLIVVVSLALVKRSMQTRHKRRKRK